MSRPHKVDIPSLPPSIAKLRETIADRAPGRIASSEVSPTDSSLAHHAAERPTHPAVLDPRLGWALSYAELRARVSSLADELDRRGLGPGDRLAVAFERSAELVVVLLAVLELGATYLPLDPAYPTERLAWMLEDSASRALLVQRGHASSWPTPPGVEPIELDPMAPMPPTARPPTGRSEPHPEAAAYMIYTSGSSGRPKGVVIPRRALAWYNATAIERYGLTPADRVLQMASTSFDISVGEIFPLLAAGGTLVLADPRPTDAIEILRTCRQRAITVLFPATALWHELAKALAEKPERLPSSLRLVSFGGEKVAAPRLVDWQMAVGPRVRLINGYGPTEATIEACQQELGSTDDPRSPQAWARSIGRPLPGVIARVLDSDLRPCDEGVAGELCLASPGLARNYHRRAARTAERFVPDPFGDRPGGRIYRTGDRVRRGESGCLEILGRLDEQIKIRGFRIEPGEIEARLSEHPAVGAAAVVAARVVAAGSGEERWLSAFVVLRRATPPTVETTSAGATGILGVGPRGPASREVDPTETELRDFLRRRLPGHLVPQRITLLDHLPLSANGKIDRQLLVRWSATPSEPILPTPDTGSRERRRHSRSLPGRDASPLEILLARLWAEGLRVGEVMLDDNYFELGGDSILGIRIAALARAEGLDLTPADLFARPTVAALASLLEERGELPSAVVRTENGPHPLTPVQRWFFDDAELAEPWHFNQSMMVALDRPVAPALLRRATAVLTEQHPVLRMRFEQTTEGWRQRVAPRETSDPLLHLELTGLAPPARRQVLTRAADTLQATLDIERGPLLRLGLFTAAGEDRLLIAIHHLVVDGVSWGILLDDFERVILALEAGHEPDLGRHTTPYTHWARLQVEHAGSPALATELDFWLDRPAHLTLLPIDPIDPIASGQDTTGDPAATRRDANTTDTVASLSRHLDRRRTEELLRRAGTAYRTRINDFLLTALALAVRRFGGGDLLVDLEGHGREEIFPGIDLSRTVGWFTSTFPVHLRLPTGDGEPALGIALTAVKERLRALPHQGVGHGMLYYLADEATRHRLRALPRPELSFNYLGQLDALLAGSHLFRPAIESRGREKGRGGRRDYLLEIDGGIVDGRLWINWQYSKALHRESTIARLADDFQRALEALIEHCLDPTHGALTPSDVPFAGLDAAALAELVSSPREVEDIYPLAPTQHGMLFHSLLGSGGDRDDGERGASPIYFEQSSWKLDGALDRQAFRRAWQRLVDRHAILRTAFRWQGLERPLQIVSRRADLPWSEHDWRHLDASEQERRSEEFFGHDRRRGFRLDRAPLTRIALLRLGQESHRLVWSYHHALLDGWSISALFDELFVTYDAFRRRLPVPELPSVPFRRYITWLAERSAREDDRGAARRFRRLLAGARPSPPPYSRVGVTRTTADSPRHRRTVRCLPKELTTAIEALTRRLRLTAGTLTQGMWSVLLARAQGDADVLYGLTVSGRPATLAGAHHIVGLLINSLPVRWRASGEQPLLPWLATIQRAMVELGEQTHRSLVDIRRLAGLPADHQLFECLLVFENYPVEQAALEDEQRRAGLRVHDFRGFSETNYPLTLAVVPGREWRLDLAWDPRRLDSVGVERMLRHFENLLADLMRRLDTHPPADLAADSGGGAAHPTLAELELLARAERHQLLIEGYAPGTRPPARDIHGQPAALGTRRPDDAPRARGGKSPQALESPPTPHLVTAGTPAGPRGEPSLPRHLAELWQRLLGGELPGPEANFFELGGHSLLAMRLIAQLRRSLGIELPLRELFEHPTLGGLATVVGESLRRYGVSATEPTMAAVARPARPPLSPGQRRLWILEQLDPGDPAHHVAGAWRLRGPLDSLVLHRALARLTHRHEALRTRFPEHRGTPWQQVLPLAESEAHALPRVDLRHLPAVRRAPCARRLADALALRPFSLAHGPLQRLLLVHLASDDHLLARSCHHLVSDAWSESLFYRELGLLYGALAAGRPSPLLPLSVQPVDAALRELAALERPETAKRLAARCARLEGLPELELPVDRPTAVHYCPGHLRRRLDPALSDTLTHHGAAAGASPFMTLVALFSALLYRLGAGDILALGSPVARRPTSEHGRMIGFFVDTVIFRLEPPTAASYEQWLEITREVALDAWRDQDLPFDTLVEALDPPRRPGRPPLVGVMVDWIDHHPTTLELGRGEAQVSGEWVETAGSSGRYELSLTGWREDGALVLDLEYDAGRFDTTTVRRWLAALERLTRAALADPRRALEAYDLSSPAERQQLLVESAGHRRVSTPVLFEALARHATQRPRAVAVVEGTSGRTLSWAELGRRVDAWRQRLSDIAPEQPVAVLVERSPECLAASLGVLASGAVWMPLDPASPMPVLRSRLRSVDARIVVAHRALLGALSAEGPPARTLAYEDCDPRPPAETPAPPRRLLPLQAAALLHTSGSTGDPKAVVLTHRAIAGYAEDARRTYDLNEHDRVLQFAHWTFDLLLEELLPALLAGAALVLRNEASVGSARAFAQFCKQQQITFATLPTAFWHRLDPDVLGRELASLDTLVIGGEKASAEHLERWRALPRPILHDTYGPTEATVVATRVPPRGRSANRETPDGELGRPIAGMRALVLDSRLRLLPPGVPGELVLAGEGLARGYHGGAAATAELFVPDPFADGMPNRPAGGRVYRTGDAARALGDGRLQFLGRLDRQLKVRGFRIDPAEIESVLEHHPQVAAAVVDAWAPPGRTPRLAAWIVPLSAESRSFEGDHPPTPEALRAFLGERLPPHHHPTIWVSLAELPLDRRGKVDRRRLPPPTLRRSGEKGTPAEPRSVTERALAALWAEVLDVEAPGREADFFALGGDSLLAIQVTDGARRTGLHLRPMDLIRHPTLAELATVLDRRGAEPTTSPRADDQPTASPGVIELTPIQRWFFEWPIEKRWHFNQSVLLAVRESLDAGCLARATAHLLHHHDALRLRFDHQAEGWRSVQTAPDTSTPFVRCELSDLSPGRAMSELSRLCAKLQASLDLSNGPLLRIAQFELPGGGQRLLVVVHHLVIDGVSWPILLDDLERAYTLLSRRRPLELPPRTTSYQRWSQALAEHARRPELLTEVSHWRRTLARLEPLPTDHTGDGPSAHATLSTRLATALTRQLLRRAGRRLEPVLLTALLRALGEWSDRRALLFELESHGRSEALPGIDVSRTIGWFTSTFPVWLELEGGSAASQVGAVERQLAAVPHDGLHFGLLRYLAPELDGIGELRRQPGPEVSFNYLGQVELALARSRYFRPAPEDPGPEQGHPGERQHRFELNGRVVGGELVMDWSYDPRHYLTSTIEALGRAYFDHLRTLLEAC